MTPTATCPWCNSFRVPWVGLDGARYACGSMIHTSGLFRQHPVCGVSELSKRVLELEDKLAEASACKVIQGTP